MTNIENYHSIAKRRGYVRMPADFNMCPVLKEKFRLYCEETGFSFKPSVVNIPDLKPTIVSSETQCGCNNTRQTRLKPFAIEILTHHDGILHTDIIT